jgi:hypothetical protein
LPSLSLFKIPGAILAHAKSLVVGGDESVSPTQAGPRSDALWLDARVEQAPPAQDNSFWAIMAGADRRLAELRRAIDEAAAEAIARETSADEALGESASLGESRFDAANRMIKDALNTEKP